MPLSGRAHVSGATAYCFLAALATVTWEKVRWAPGGGDIALSEIFATAFIVLFVADRVRRGDERVGRTAAQVGGFAVTFVLLYLLGFWNLQNAQQLDQFTKGLGKYVLHMAFLVAGLAYLARRSERFYWRALGWFCGGMAVNAAYGVLQLAAARAGHNLDALVLSPLTHGASKINVYGVAQGSTVYRPNALTGDPNHLAIMLDLPLLVLGPIGLRLPKGHRLGLRLAAALVLMLLVEIATLSRSGLLGLALGMLGLVFPYRRRLRSRAFLAPAAAAAAVLVYVVLRRPAFYENVIRSRLHVRGASVHFQVYDFIPKVIHAHPLLGFGINTFSVYYEFVTGKTNWGPHSFYVALVVESGLVGAVVFAVYLSYVFTMLRRTRALGRRLAAAREAVSVHVRPLGLGLTAALVATLAANVFYLTMTFFYFFAFLALALAPRSVFGRRLQVAARTTRSLRP